MKIKILSILLVLSAICISALADEQSLNQSKIIGRRMVLMATTNQLNSVVTNYISKPPPKVRAFFIRKINATKNENEIAALTNQMTIAGIGAKK